VQNNSTRAANADGEGQYKADSLVHQSFEVIHYLAKAKSDRPLEHPHLDDMYIYLYTHIHIYIYKYIYIYIYIYIYMHLSR